MSLASAFEEPIRLFARPVAILKSDQRVVLKRGCTEVAVDGAYAAEIVTAIFERAKTGLSAADLDGLFSPQERDAVWQLVDQLVQKDLLYRARNGTPESDRSETSTDVFFWHFGLTAAQARDALSRRLFVVVGLNSISREIGSGLFALGASAGKVVLVDDPLLRNSHWLANQQKCSAEIWSAKLHGPQAADLWREEAAPGSCDCLIATSDFGGQNQLRPWNELSHRLGFNFLPVLLDNMIGQVGPFVVPRQSPCLECLRIRQNTNTSDPDLVRTIQNEAPACQAVNGFHPLMNSVTSNIALFEILRFYTSLPQHKVGMLVEVNLLSGSVTSRRVLKVPRCPVCSSASNRPTTATFKNPLFLPAD